MSSLAFPAGAQFRQPAPLGHGSGRPDDIPIDPALSGLQFDPALAEEVGSVRNTEAFSLPVPFGYVPIPPPRQYSQGPQGDPFAPYPSPTYPAAEEPAPPPSKPGKKRRQPRREEECMTCHGGDNENQDKQPEKMVSCAVCGRSVHPSCAFLAEISDVVLSYDWKCFECKNCEICRRKGDDSRLILCDSCDRGWHFDCLDPPLIEPPPGKWHCPLCPSPPPHDVQLVEHSTPVLPPQTPNPFRASSVASSSHIAEGNQVVPESLVTDESEVDVDGEATPSVGKNKSKKLRSKGKAPMRNDPDEAMVSPTAPARSAKRTRLRLSSPMPPPQPVPVLRLRLPPRGKGKAREEDSEETKRGLFDEVLNPEDRDTSSTSIANNDKQRFEKSRLAAEDKLFPRPALLEVSETAGAGPSTRPLRSTMHAPAPAVMPTPDRSVSPTPSTPGPLTSKAPNGLRIRCIRFGEFDIETWYDAPFPEEYANMPEGRLWICEFCLKYMKSRFGAGRHQTKCKMRHPPGDEIYRDGAISVFEVDGRKNKIYCQNLCLLSKMFLDHKSLFYDVEPFLFYVITEVDDSGARFVGYFSKEKRSPKDYNVSCIMTLPVRQRQGWGQLLIDFSYLLSKKEQRPGSPEKPLSALGALGYKSYWTHSIMRYLRTAPPDPRLEDISAATSMTLEDTYNTLVQLNMISFDDAASAPRPLPGQTIKFPKGRKNGVARKHLQRTQTQDDIEKRGPFVLPTKYEIHWDPEEVDEYFVKWDAKNYLKLKPEKLKWSPFIIARTRKTEQLPIDLENGQAEAGISQTGDVTPWTDVPATPRPGSSLEGRPTTRSPALALFDDDNVVSVSPVTPDPSVGVFPDKQLVRSPSPEPESAAQMQQDRALALKMSNELNSSNRRLRSRDLSDSTPASEKSRRPSDETPAVRKGGSATMRGGDTPSTPTPSRNGARLNGRGGLHVDASAADVASEEGQAKRQLRSRSNTEQEAKSAVSTPRSASPRKRRRVDSSPEAEVAPAPQPLRRSLRLPTENEQTVAASPRLQRKSSRLNGDAPANDGLSPMPLSTRSIPSSSHGAETSGRDGDTGEVVDRPNMSVDHPSAQRPRVVLDAQAEDLKYEDVDTPMTAMTSRHSVPSDDTMFVEDGGAADKVSPDGQTVDVAMQPPGAQAVQRTGDAMEIEEGGDEDAEGEEDVDAEGEPDVEGEPGMDIN